MIVKYDNVASKVVEMLFKWHKTENDLATLLLRPLDFLNGLYFCLFVFLIHFCLNTEEVVLDFTQECDVPLMEVDSDIDGLEDTLFADRSRNYVDEAELKMMTKINLFS